MQMLNRQRGTFEIGFLHFVVQNCVISMMSFFKTVLSTFELALLDKTLSEQT